MIPICAVVTNKISETQSVNVKKRKVVRKLVDKMYVDDDGSMGKHIFIIITLYVKQLP